MDASAKTIAKPARWLFGALASLVAFVAMAAPGPALAEWVRAESPRFVVYGAGDERYVRGYAEKLEAFEQVLRAYHGMAPEAAPPRKFEVYLVSGLGQLRRVKPDADESTGGFYSAGVEKVFAVVRRDFGDDQILFHEYTHHFMSQHFPYGYPAWVVEGYAEYFGGTRVDDQFIDVGAGEAGRTYVLTNLRHLALSDLLTRRPGELKGDQVKAYYAQAWLLTHYMLSDPARKQQMDAYLRAVGAGENPARAMAQATGMDLDMLGRKLKAYDKLTYTRVPRSAAGAEIRVSHLPPSADDLLLESIRPHETVPPAEQPAFLEKIRTLASKHHGDPLAYLTAAKAEISFGDRPGGEAILRFLLKANPDNAEALELLGMSRLASGDEASDPVAQKTFYREARPYLIKAGQKDPTRYQTLFAYVRSRSLEDGYPNDNDLNALLAARALAPQVSEITLRAAEALDRRKRPAEAVAILTPVANDPHQADAAAAARAVLARVKPIDQKPPAIPATTSAPLAGAGATDKQR